VHKTLEQYDTITIACKELFVKKNEDYGSSWRIFRTSSLTDQLYIKAMRIRSIEEAGENKVGDAIEDDYKGLINYGIMALIQSALGTESELELSTERLKSLYDGKLDETRSLMIAKNHDYGEVWREMRISSITDLILVKLLRIKQIEDNDGKTIVSEGLDANFMDIINYAVFALIKLSEKN